MKKFLTIMMILIATMGIGFATPQTGEAPAPATKTLSFTFNWSGQASEAKTYVGFYSDALVGIDSIAMLENLSGKTAITGPIAIDKTSKSWAPGTVVYATAGTNYIPKETKLTLTLNPLKAAGENDMGYDVTCTVLNGTGILKDGAGFTGGAIAVAGGEPLGTPVVLTANIQAKVKDPDPAQPEEIQQLDGTNGLFELLFENMKVDAVMTGENPFAPTYGIQPEMIKNYKADWTFSVTTL